MEAWERVSGMDYQSSGGSGSQDSLPAATAEVIESAVMLAKAEVKLALAETKEVALRALVGMAWVLVTGFLLQAAVGLLVLGPLLTMDLSPWVRWLLLLCPVALAVGSGTLAYLAIQRAMSYGKR